MLIRVLLTHSQLSLGSRGKAQHAQQIMMLFRNAGRSLLDVAVATGEIRYAVHTLLHCRLFVRGTTHTTNMHEPALQRVRKDMHDICDIQH